MSHEERTHLIEEIEEIRSTIERVQAEVYSQETGDELSRRALLIALRKDLARDMDQLHAN